MCFPANEKVLQADPNYWWEQAEMNEQTIELFAAHASEHEAYRRDMCEKCHAVLERELKALLAEKHDLSEGHQSTHKLQDFLDDLPEIKLNKRQQKFVNEFNNLHVKANYPNEPKAMAFWNNGEKLRAFLGEYCLLNAMFKSKRTVF